MASSGPISLAEIFGHTTAVMQAELARIRAAMSHPGEKGTALEEVVAQFLNDHMPSAIRATAGQIVDRTGAVSGQTDVIIYDATRTPMLFTSARGQRNTAPAEGVLGVVEVKTRLTPDELTRSIKHMQKIKGLVRDAYFETSQSFLYLAYGKTWRSRPIVYSVFAFEGDGLYADILNEAPHHDLPLERRIDNLVVLDRGVCLAATVALQNPGARFSPSPTPHSAMVDVETPHALATWFAMCMSDVMQAVGGRPINLSAYMTEQLTSLTGTSGSGTAGMKELRDNVVDQLADTAGLPAQIFRLLVNGFPEMAQEKYSAFRRPEHVPPQGSSREAARERELAALARDVPFKQWLEVFIPMFISDEADTP